MDDDFSGSDNEELLRELAQIVKSSEKAVDSVKKQKSKKGGFDDLMQLQDHDDIDDAALEAELDALLMGSAPTSSSKPAKAKAPVKKPAEEDNPFDEDSISLSELSESSEPAAAKKPTQEIAVSVAPPALPARVESAKDLQKPEAKAPAPPLPPRVESQPAKESSPKTAPRPVPMKIEPPPEEPTPPAPTTSQSEGDGFREKALATLNRRREAFIANVQAALADHNKAYAVECAESVAMFDQALEYCKDNEISAQDLAQAPATPPPYRRKIMSLEEELMARIKKFEEIAAASEQKGDGLNARSKQRLAGQLKTALAQHRKGIPIQPEQLPVPVGFLSLQPLPKSARASPHPVATPSAAVGDPLTLGASAKSLKPEAPSPPTREEILAKQLDYKKAAVAAKNRGDLPAAAKFLKAAKLLDDQLAATGKPKSAAAPSTSAAAVTAVASKSPSAVALSEGVGDTNRVEANLRRQMDLMAKLRTQFHALNDAKRCAFYDELIRRTKTDWKVCHGLAANGVRSVSFKLNELRLPTLELNPAVESEIMELRIKSVTGTRLPVGWTPADAALFIAYDFPFPADAHQTGKTKTVYGTVDPVFDEVIRIQINRRARQLQRIAQRQPLRMQLLQKGGFLRSDKSCGEAELKWDALLEKATLVSELEPLRSSRQPTGATMSVEVRLLKPLDEKKMHTTTAVQWVRLTNQTPTTAV